MYYVSHEILSEKDEAVQEFMKGQVPPAIIIIIPPPRALGPSARRRVFLRTNAFPLCVITHLEKVCRFLHK